MEDTRQWNVIIQTGVGGGIYKPRILYLPKISFKNKGEIKAFQHKNEVLTIYIFVLQEILKKVFKLK
jgi:hypothetical protein